MAGSAAAQDGESRSSFRVRVDGPPAVLVVPVQAKSTNPTPAPGATQPGTPTAPGTTPPGGTPVPPRGPGNIPGTTDPLPGGPGVGPPRGPGAGVAGPDTGMPGVGTRAGQDPYEAYIRLEPPGREKLFGTLETERELEERMRQERRDTGVSGDTIQFPEKPKLTDQAYQPRQFSPMAELAEPNYVVYRRLYFEDKNSERYGWDLGPAQPVVSTLYFFKDLILFPHNFASYPCRRFETNAGQCTPGDPVPYILYPPEFTWTGLLAEGGAAALMAYVVVP